jgi:glycerophosphoryl diester phosphodiesterase
MTAVLAHRGSPLPPGAPENTLAAFRRAADLGANGVELDVRRSADGVLVLHHDIEVAGLGPVAMLEHGRLPAGLATLGEALELCGGLGLFVNIEVKSETAGSSHDPAERCARDAATLCLEHDVPGGIVVSSFSPAALAAARETSAELPLAFLVGGGSPMPLSWGTGELGALGLEGIHPHDSLVDGELVSRARHDGLALRVWTVNDPDRVAVLARLGADAVVTDDVPAARVALGGAPERL